MELTFFGGDWSAMLNLEIFAVNDWWLNLVTFNEAVINSTRKRDELELALARAEHSLSLMAMLPTYVWHCKMPHTVWPSKFERFTQTNPKPQATHSLHNVVVINCHKISQVLSLVRDLNPKLAICKPTLPTHSKPHAIHNTKYKISN